MQRVSALMSGDMLGRCLGSSEPIWRIWICSWPSPRYPARLTSSTSQGFGAQPLTPRTANVLTSPPCWTTTGPSS
jgi:hypothetical protein